MPSICSTVRISVALWAQLGMPISDVRLLLRTAHASLRWASVWSSKSYRRCNYPVRRFVRRTGFLLEDPSRQQFWNEMTVNVGETAIDAIVPICEARMIDAQQVQQRGMQI